MYKRHSRIWSKRLPRAASDDRRLLPDVAKNALHDFRPEPKLDCHYEAAQVVRALNHVSLSITKLKAEAAFEAALQRINLCGRCRLPIKVNFTKLNGGTRRFVWADIPAHFEWTMLDDGKAYYHYIDGTDRTIYVKVSRRANPYPSQKKDKSQQYRTESVQEKFFELLDDGTKLQVVPQKSYRLIDVKCECDRR